MVYVFNGGRFPSYATQAMPDEPRIIIDLDSDSGERFDEEVSMKDARPSGTPSGTKCGIPRVSEVFILFPSLATRYRTAYHRVPRTF